MKQPQYSITEIPISITMPLYVEAFKDALLIDLPIYFILSGGNPVAAAAGFTGAFAGYTYRKYCNYYLDDKLDNNLLKAAVCGIPGGITKYGIANVETLVNKGIISYLPKLALGAYNNFMYEAYGPGKMCSNEIGCTFYNTISIEGSEGIVENFINYLTNQPLSTATIVGGINAGYLVGGTIYTTYSTFSDNIDQGYLYLSEILYPSENECEVKTCSLEEQPLSKTSNQEL
jgi:hypothetical protein